LYLLVLVLNRVELLEEILETLVRAGVPGATIIDSTGMGRTLAQADHDASFLAGLRSIFQYSRPENKTIFSVVRTKEKLEKARAAVQEVLGNISRPGVGIIFTLQLLDVTGLGEEDL
jgi:nitrogen regulatory protein P-II 1